MKRILTKFAVLAAVLASLCAPSAFAQAAAAMPPCSGVVVTVRVSEITPEGSVETFKAAVAAHLKWYRDHGFKNNQIVIGQIVDPETHSYSDKKFMTYHINPPNPATTKTDAAWDAYVKLYQGTSKILETYITCMPETVVSTDPVPWMKM